MENKKIPDIVVARLPIYLTMLKHLQMEKVMITSSKKLESMMGISAAQIRKDLSYFGEFGKQGSGYSVMHLIEVLQDILNLKRTWDLAIIGAGSLGTAIAKYPGFKNHHFRVAMIFDSNPEVIGSIIGDLTVKDSRDINTEIPKACIHIAMLTLPASEAQKMADLCIKSGIKAILNYAPITLIIPQGVQVQYLDPIQQLQHMTYYLK